MTRTILLSLAVALAACRPAGDSAKSGESLAEGGAAVEAPTGKTGDPVADSVANDSLANVVTEDGTPRPTMIPDQFHGRWALVPADCKGDAAAKGLLTIDDSRLVFYESRGVLDRIDAWQPANRFTANYGFTGEGQEWERVITLERTGSKLRRTESGSEEGPVDLTYTACPA